MKIVPAWGNRASDRASRSDGYVVDTSYTEPLAMDLCPARLSLAAVLHGQPPLDLHGPLDWFDLGCGNGLAACTVAAGNPNVRVWGCDFNPAHIARARHLASEAGLTNCSFDEASFEAIVRDDGLGGTGADVIVIHGVYSWIARHNQDNLVEFIRRRLRPGGLAYVMYEVPTGWASMVPLAEVMRLAADADPRRSDLAFPDAASAAVRLAEGSNDFPVGGHEAAQLASLANVNGAYAAHEYLGKHFQPLMFDQVSSAMRGAGCSFIGSMDATDQLYRFWAPPELTDMVVQLADPVLQQMARDVITQRALRRDLFKRGPASPTAVQREHWWEDLSIVGLDKALAEDAAVPVPVGEVTLDLAFYRPLVERLANDSLTVADIRALHSGVSLPDAVGALALLVGGGYAAPEVPEWHASGARESSRRLNRVLTRENRTGAGHEGLVAPALGTTIDSEYVETLVLAALWEGAAADARALSERVLNEMASQRRGVQEDGQPVHDESAARSIVERRVHDAIVRAQGTLLRLGVC